MGRMRKTPKPKQAAYERIEPDKDPEGVYDVLDEARRKFKPELSEAEIACAWRHGWKRNKDGQLVLGKCKKVSDLDKQFQGFDFIVILNREAWKELSAEQRLALVHHELCHAALSEDQNGNPKKDARGRQMFRIRKHDVEEFGEVIEHHGCYKTDLENFVLTALRSKKPPQSPLPGLDAEPSTKGHVEPSANGSGHADRPATIAAAARFRNPPAGRGKKKALGR